MDHDLDIGPLQRATQPDPRISRLRYPRWHPRHSARSSHRPLRRSLHHAVRQLRNGAAPSDFPSQQHSHSWPSCHDHGNQLDEQPDWYCCCCKSSLWLQRTKTLLTNLSTQQIFLPKYGPTYKTPFYISLGLSIFSFVGYIAFRILIVSVNRWRAKKVASMTLEEIEEENNGTTRIGDKKWTFQYTT